MSLASAIRTGDLAELPSRRDEDWRWTDIRGLVRALPPASRSAPPPATKGPFHGLADRAIALVNGHGEDRLTASAGSTQTIALRFIAADGAGAHAGRLSVKVEAGARLTLLESYEGQATDYISEIDIDFDLAADAQLDRVVLAADGAEAVSVSLARMNLGPRSQVRQIVLTGGARRQRIETRVLHPGAAARVQLDGVYVLAGKRHADLTTVVEHRGAGGATDQLTKGVVADQSRGVFQGRILVGRGADQTNARMGHHALVLSDRAEVDAKPELEIFADDVLCAHGNTVGSLDENALFYAAQRGIPQAAARRLLTEAFLGEVIDRIAAEGPRGVARAWLSERLEAGP